MLTQGRQCLILVLKTDLSSIQKTEQSPNFFSARCHDLHVRESLGPFRDEGCQWAGMDTDNSAVID